MTSNSMKMIFIHGAGGTKNKWRTMKKRFAEEEVILYELPGHGGNQGEPYDSIEAHGKELSRGISEDCILVGHSMGGLIALEAASLNEHVKGIVLVASSYQLPVHPKVIERLKNGEFSESLFRASFGKQANPSLIQEEKQERGIVPPEVAVKDFQACDAYKNGEGLIEEMEKPILAIIGDEDRLVPPDTVDDLKRKNSSIKLHVLEGVGHYPMLETPEQTASAIQMFRQSILSLEGS